jgi:hypothetical protein
MLKLIVLYHLRLLKEEQSKEVLGLQRWWAENLIRNHIRHHSSRTSCPEITHMMLNKLPYHTRNGFIDLAYKRWLVEFNNASNFEAMLKCMFVFQQLRDEWGINAFYWIMSQPISLLYPNNLPIGFEFCDYYMGYPRAIPVGKRLSLFFFHLRSHHVIDAISHIKIFIQYAIDNTQGVNLIKPDSFGDLVFLMEFVTSLIFAISPRCCDFLLSRAYLVNYFDRFTAIPLIPGNLRRAYNRENYLAAIMNSIDQIRQLLSLLINKEQTHFTIIIRLIRLLVLIGLNESTCSSYILNLFKYLDKKFSSSEIKKFDHRSISDQSYIISKYLEQKTMGLLVNVLHKDLKETGCDSLVIVYYQLEGIPSKFSDWEKHGIIKLAYNSIEGFRSALQQIKSSVNILENVPDNDTTLDEIYNDMIIFCQAMKEKGENAVNKYIILLKGWTVDVIVKLIKLQGRMEETKNRLKNTINSHSSDTNKIDRCLELEDELKFVTFN